MKLSVQLPLENQDLTRCMSKAAIKPAFQSVFTLLANVKIVNNHGNLLMFAEQHMNIRTPPEVVAKWLEIESDTKFFMFWSIETIREAMLEGGNMNKPLNLIAAAYIHYYYRTEICSDNEFELFSAIGNSLEKYNEIIEQFFAIKDIEDVYTVELR